MKIETATIQDIDTLVSLFKQTIDAEKQGVPSYLLRYAKDKRVRILRTDGGIIGAYIYHISRYSNPYTKVLHNKRVVWLDQLMVFPWAQRKGYGKELLKDFSSIPIKEYRLICLQSLVTYYQQFNFEVVETGIRKGEEYFIMRKHI